MSKNLRNCMNSMQIICDTKCKKLQKSLLKEMSKNDNYFKALYEIVRNLYLKNLKVKPSMRLKLKKHFKILKDILSHPKSIHKRRSLVVQSGGFLQAILPLLGTVISEIVRYAVG